MGKYILKRVLQFIPVFIGVTMILFAMKAIVPGDPVKIITGGKQVTPETELQIRISNGLIETDENNKPIYDENGDTIPTTCSMETSAPRTRATSRLPTFSPTSTPTR